MFVPIRLGRWNKGNEENFCCVRRGYEPHPGRSCLLGGLHIVFCRHLTSDEWSEFSRRIDEVWAGDCWDPEGMVKLMEEIAGVHPVLVEA